MGVFGFNKNNKQESNANGFINIMEHMFGSPCVIREVEAEDGGKPIHVFFWRDLPKEGTLTSVTYGLSEGNHPDWKNGKCEIILSLDTNDESWGIGTAIFASQFRGKKSFSYGSVFTTDTSISKESDMCSFFVFAPSFLEQHQAVLHLPASKIFLAGMYPIYKEEVAVYNELGLKKFWHHPNFDMYNVRRDKVAL